MNCLQILRSNLLGRSACRWLSIGVTVSTLFIVAACVSNYGKATKIGALSHEGVDYDVYRATLFDEGREFPRIVFVKKGDDPQSFGGRQIVYGCGTFDGVTRAECEARFRRSFKKKTTGGLAGGTDN